MMRADQSFSFQLFASYSSFVPVLVLNQPGATSMELAQFDKKFSIVENCQIRWEICWYYIMCDKTMNK